MQEGEQVNINPKDNTYLLGQEKAEQILLNAWKNNSLHNSWLLSGVEGIGKATLAYRFARFLLAADWEKRAQYTSLENSHFSLAFRQASPSEVTLQATSRLLLHLPSITHHQLTPPP